ncbi:hypothetical protein D3C84_752850 [compost metagenome]
MHHRAAPERQQRFQTAALALGSAVHAVLLHGGLHRLGEVGLQLHRGHRNAVDEEGQVDLVGLIQRVTQLRHHAQAVGRITGDHRVVALVFGQRLAHGQGAATGYVKAVAQRIHRATIGLVLQLLDQPIQHHRLGARTVHGAQLGHGRRLTVLQPAQHILGKQRPPLVIVSRLAHPPAGSLKLLDDMAFQFAFVVDVAHGHSFGLRGIADLVNRAVETVGPPVKYPSNKK